MEGSVESPVAEFYKDKTVFITGATGFMGKVLVEKLLRSTSVARIYLLIRPKKGVLTQQRLAVLLGTKIFDRVRKEKEEALSRVVAVSGDITEDRLGLSEEEENVLAETVNIVFHCAATVRFDEDLTKSIGMNVSGVLAVVALAKKMARLEALVDVSTAYCNCDIPHIEERVYPAPGDPHGMIDMCTWMDPSLLDAPDITKKMIGNRPNTYTFTKALAESLLSTEATELPVAIMRPSIVSASLNEPYPGWVDNFNGPSGIIAAAGKGIMRTLHCKRDCIADMVPVDICINLLVCVAWQTAKQAKGAPIKVYNCTSGGINPITWGQVEVWGLDAILDVAYEGALWYPGGSYQENWRMNRLLQLAFHYGPAQIVDLGCRLVGQKPFLVKVSEMMQKSTKALEPFTTGSWTWTSSNTKALGESLTEEDREKFGFDIQAVHWPSYLKVYAQGIRDYVFKENPATQAACRRKLIFLWLLDWLVKGGFVLLILWTFLKCFL